MTQQKPKSLTPQCPICHSDFDIYYKTPRVVPKCGHTFCQKCINNKLQIRGNRKMFVCTECGGQVVIRKGVAEDVPKNIGVIDIVRNIRKFISNQKEEEKRTNSQSCPDHHKPLDLVCQTCKYQKICSHCALFGSHRSHSFCKQMPASKIDLNQLKQIFQIISESIKETILPNSTNNIKKAMKVNICEGLKKQIKEHFRQYYDILERKEIETLIDCEQVEINQGGIYNNIDRVVGQYDTLMLKYQNQWQNQIQGKINKTISLDSIDEFINCCKQLHSSVETLQKYARDSVGKLLKQIGIKISHSIIFKIQELPFSLKRLIQNPTITDITSPQRRARMKSTNSDTKNKGGVMEKEESKGGNLQIFDKHQNKSHNQQVAKDSWEYLSKFEKNEELQQLDFSSIDNPRNNQSTGGLTQKPPTLKQNLVAKPLIPSDKSHDIYNKTGNIPKMNKPKKASQLENTRNAGKSFREDKKGEDKKAEDKKEVSQAKAVSVVNRTTKQSTTGRNGVSGVAGNVVQQLKFVRPNKEIAFQYLSKLHQLMIQIDRQSQSHSLQLVSSDLNDTLLLYILDYLRTKKYKFQLMKLVKNAITDEGFRILLSHLLNDNHTQVLNLTSNQLTSKCLDTILHFAGSNNTLKNIYLSNNKVSGFMVKGRKGEFDKYQIQVVV